jgi:DNA-binding NarL/FixJ family response regulator
MVCSACLLASARTVRPGDQLDELTPRETIVELVAEGFSNKEIGSRLGLNEKTLKHYMTNVLQKMSCKKCLAKISGAKPGWGGDQMGQDHALR